MSTNTPTQAAAEEPKNKPTAEMDATPRLTIIGIGASAGGLTALRKLFTALPSDSGLTFVVVVHLSPAHESILAELLQPCTTMPVVQVTSRVQMQPDHVYVIPPAKSLIVRDNTLDLKELTNPRGRHTQIDSFFRSLAEEHGDGVAMILSGSGSDGAVGMQAIKEGGGGPCAGAGRSRVRQYAAQRRDCHGLGRYCSASSRVGRTTGRGQTDACCGRIARRWRSTFGSSGTRVGYRFSPNCAGVWATILVATNGPRCCAGWRGGSTDPKTRRSPPTCSGCAKMGKKPRRFFAIR